MKKIELSMTLSKETKGTFVYAQDADDEGKPPVISSLYVARWALGSKPPTTIKVVLSE